MSFANSFTSFFCRQLKNLQQEDIDFIRKHSRDDSQWIIQLDALNVDVFLRTTISGILKHKVAQLGNSAVSKNKIGELFNELWDKFYQGKISGVEAIQIARETTQYIDAIVAIDTSHEIDEHTKKYLRAVNPIFSSRPWLKALVFGLVGALISAIPVLHHLTTVGVMMFGDMPQPLSWKAATLFSLVPFIGGGALGAWYGWTQSRGKVDAAEPLTKALVPRRRGL